MKTLLSRCLLFCSLVSILLLSGPQLFSAANATLVEGDILEDTTWAAAYSPYMIVNTVTVKINVTLTIEPDVVMLFTRNTSLIVEGSLFAVGNSSHRIVFISGKPDPTRGGWAGIRFFGGENESFILKFADVKFAENGILIESLGKAAIEECEIASNSVSGVHVIGLSNVVVKDCTITLNGNGVSTAGSISCGMRVVYNNISSNDENGIYVYTSGADVCRIFNVTISGNHISQNGNGIYVFSNAGTENSEAYIQRVTVSRNVVSSNGYGVRLRTQAWDNGYIVDSTISNNTVSFNEEGISIYSGSNWYRWIANVTISENKVFANMNGVSLDGYRICAPYDPFSSLPFDANVIGNVISANDDKGITVLGDVRTNFTGNSVSYNSYGIYITTWRNHAFNNDIYENSLYGMYVTNFKEVVKAEVKADGNFWGASSGPYHKDLNSDGKGDWVGGDGEIDFTPWLTEPFGSINHAPVPKLEVETSTMLVNQTVSFDGSASSDDSRIIKFFFDFGDGETSVAVTSLVQHEYASPGFYDATLIVMDELGVKSNDTAVKTITVKAPSLVVQLIPNPPSVGSQAQVLIKVYVTNGTTAMKEAFVQLTSDGGGSFQPPFGYTDSNGDFNSTYTAPTVSETTNVRIVAAASKEGYEESTGEAYLPVLVQQPKGMNPTLAFMLLAAIVAAAVVAAVAITRRKKRRSQVARVS
jgi:hypothetical protein